LILLQVRDAAAQQDAGNKCDAADQDLVPIHMKDQQPPSLNESLCRNLMWNEWSLTTQTNTVWAGLPGTGKAKRSSFQICLMCQYDLFRKNVMNE
jgi:hypothetical protein